MRIILFSKMILLDKLNLFKPLATRGGGGSSDILLSTNPGSLYSIDAYRAAWRHQLELGKFGVYYKR